MITMDNPQKVGGDIRVIAIAYFFATIISGTLVTEIGIHLPRIATTASRDESLVLSLIGSLVLAAAVAPLARGLRGTWVARWLAMSIFTYVSFAVINQMQAAEFSTFDGTKTMLIFFVLPCLVASAAAAWLGQSADAAAAWRTVFHRRPRRTWWWRLSVAFVALPIVESISGLMWLPFLDGAFRQQDLTLVVPAGAVIFRTLLLKSGLLLVVTIPIVCMWTRSRRQLILALGLAFFILTGLVGLVQASWWPVSLRVMLASQVLLTSMAYASVVVALLVPTSPRR